MDGSEPSTAGWRNLSEERQRYGVVVGDGVGAGDPVFVGAGVAGAGVVVAVGDGAGTGVPGPTVK